MNNVLHRTKLPSNSSEQNSFAVKQYQSSFFESLMPEQNRNKANYIEKKKKNQNEKTESTLRKQQARQI